MNAAVGLRINSRMHMTQQISSGPIHSGMLEMIEEVENMTNGDTNPEAGSNYMVDQSGYSDAHAARMLADANGGDPNKVLYGFPPSYPVRPHGHL
jgi:hypothetical protein